MCIVFFFITFYWDRKEKTDYSNTFFLQIIHLHEWMLVYLVYLQKITVLWVVKFGRKDHSNMSLVKFGRKDHSYMSLVKFGRKDHSNMSQVKFGRKDHSNMSLVKELRLVNYFCHKPFSKFSFCDVVTFCCKNFALSQISETDIY